MKQSYFKLLLVFILFSPLVLVSCGELSTPGDPIRINSSPPTEAYLEEPYTNLIRVTGGLNSYTFKIEKGELPPGLSLSTLGQIQGIPTTEGDYAFTVVVTDANLSKTFSDMTLSVRKAPPARLFLNIPTTQMNEVFPIRPEILDARALQGFRTKLSWDSSKVKLVEDSLVTTSDRIIMFEKIEDGSLQVDIAIKGEALTGNHQLFTFNFEPLANNYVFVEGDVEFVKNDGKRGFQKISEGINDVSGAIGAGEQDQTNGTQASDGSSSVDESGGSNNENNTENSETGAQGDQ